MNMKKLMLLLSLIASLAISLAQYIPNETANIIAQVSDVWGNPVDNANCIAYIFDPDLNLIYSNTLTYKNGFYVSNFTIPGKYGTYLEYVVCNVTIYGKTMTIKSAKTFYVSSAFDVIERQLREYVSNTTLNVSVSITGNLTEAVEKAQEDLTGLLLALHSTPETGTYCINDTARMVIKTATWHINNKDYNITKNEVEYCEFGCNNVTGECIASPANRTLTLVFIAIGLVLLLFIVWRLIA